MGNNRHIKTSNRIIASFLLAMVSLLYCGSTMFIHPHNVNGETIWHSHPFTGAHHTSKAHVLSIAQINCFSFDIADEQPLLGRCDNIVVEVSTPCRLGNSLFTPIFHPLRAPPVV